MHISKIYNCILCNSNHGLWQCSKFLQMTHEQKFKTVNNMNYCVNCLVTHFNKPCKSTKRCRNCLENHNTLLHRAIKTKPSTSAKSNNMFRSQTKEISPSSTHVTLNGVSKILLYTAIIKVIDKYGRNHTMRVLIDQGSQISLINENATQLLGLKRSQCQGKIFGVGQKENNCKGVIYIRIQLMYNEFSLSTNLPIMKDLIKSLPNFTFTKPSWAHTQNIKLADPEFYRSWSINRPTFRS